MKIVLNSCMKGSKTRKHDAKWLGVMSYKIVQGGNCYSLGSWILISPSKIDLKYFISSPSKLQRYVKISSDGLDTI